jgi:hypothetical protein
MKSPFPGMDPYLEQHWRDVHHRLITYACDLLQEKMPADLRARVEERVFVESAFGTERSSCSEARAIEEPLILHMQDEPVSEGRIEIIDVGSGQRVVTVIEFLSVSNMQPGEGRDLYLAKQREMRDAGVSLVEIDLLRGGQWALAVPRNRVPADYRTPYQVCVRRGWRPQHAEVYRVPLRSPLPTIRIPLRESDEDATLPLQQIIDQCYRNGRYDDIDYTIAPHPPLEADDAAWLDELLRERGKR